MEISSRKHPTILKQFITHITRIAAEEPNRGQTIDQIKPHFAKLLADPAFLAEAYRKVVPGKFAQYALYRAENRLLSIMSMVVPPGTTTPVHDHLAWGLVGVYQGAQKETIYRRRDDGSQTGFADLEEVATRVLNPGDITTLLPPDGDIHKIETVSQEPSISIHVLGNDIGCEIRHAYRPEQKTVRPFRSGYQNAPCLQARFDHQHLVVENVEETVVFYEEILGAEQIDVKAVDGTPIVRLEMNGMPIVISGRILPGIGSHCGYAIDDLDAAVDELRTRGVQFLTEPIEQDGIRSVFITDTAGNPVELIETVEARLSWRNDAQF